MVKLRKKDEWMRRDAPELAIVKPAVWKLVQVRLSVNEGKPKVSVIHRPSYTLEKE